MKKKFLLIALVFVAMFSFVASQVVKGVEPFYNITGIYLRSDEASVGDKLYVDLNMIKKDNSTKITGYFLNPNWSYISLPLKDINTRNPYFEISSYMQAGTTYTMTMLDVEDSEGRITYTLSPGGENYMNPMGKNVVRIKNKPALIGLDLLGEREIDINGSLKLELRANQEVTFATVVLQNKNISSSKALVSVKINQESIIELSKLGSQKLLPGDYSITDVFLNPDNQSKYVHYSVNPEDTTIQQLNYDTNFKITSGQNNSQDSSNYLKSISLTKTEAGLNEKVGVDINTDGKMRAATLIFTKDDESMTVNLKGLNNNSIYFVVPFTTGAGEYELNYAILTDDNGNKHQYRKGGDYYEVKHFDFNSKLNVKNEVAQGELLSLDNNKITSDIIDKIRSLEGNIVIEINGDNNPVITKELFEAIQGSDKTLIIVYDGNEWIFNGLDINNPKQIDVSLNLYSVKENGVFDGKVQDGIVLDFPENGELPGKCLIKIYDSKFIADIINRKDVNIYYYNKELDKFEVVDLGNHFNEDGSYEFYLSHNSMYVMTVNTISDEFLVSGGDGTAQRMPFMIATIVLSVMLVILLMAIWYNINYGKQKRNAEKSIGGDTEL